MYWSKPPGLPLSPCAWLVFHVCCFSRVLWKNCYMCTHFSLIGMTFFKALTLRVFFPNICWRGQWSHGSNPITGIANEQILGWNFTVSLEFSKKLPHQRLLFQMNTNLSYYFYEYFSMNWILKFIVVSFLKNLPITETCKSIKISFNWAKLTHLADFDTFPINFNKVFSFFFFAKNIWKFYLTNFFFICWAAKTSLKVNFTVNTQS